MEGVEKRRREGKAENGKRRRERNPHSLAFCPRSFK
jgi:hypothetical protein